MRICVSGANGFVGKTLCTHLERAGHEVVRAARRAGAGVVAVGDVGPDTDWRAALTPGPSPRGRGVAVDAAVYIGTGVGRDSAGRAWCIATFATICTYYGK